MHLSVKGIGKIKHVEHEKFIGPGVSCLTFQRV